MSTWNAIRVVYFEADQTRLIGSLLGPLALDRLGKDGVRRVVLRAHWRQGPHVVLAADCPARTFDELIFPEARPAIEAWLAAYPSVTALDADAYARQSSTLASLEADDGPLTPLLANNTVGVGSYEPALPLGVPALADLRDQFLCDALGLVLDLLAMRAQDRDSFYCALAAMMACVNEVSGDEQFKHISFRGHSESYLVTIPGARERFRPFEARYQAGVTQAVREAIDEFAAGTRYDGKSTTLSRWAALVDELARSIRPIVHENIDQIRLASSEQIARLDHIKDNPMVDSLRSAPVQAVLSREEHIVFRVAINFFYLLLPLLNISPTQRFCLSHLVANACDAVTGAGWLSLMRGQNAAPPERLAGA